MVVSSAHEASRLLERGEIAKSLTPLPWPERVRAASADSISRILICLGLVPAMQSHGLPVVGFLAHATLFALASGCTVY